MNEQVTRTPTPWAAAGDHGEVVRHLDALLRRFGVEPATLRQRMIAHGAFASGWQQRCANHNIWKVKIGSSPGRLYLGSTVEQDSEGNEYTVENDKWRSFGSFREATADYCDRIGPDSWNEHYKAAWEGAHAEGEDGDETFFSELRKGGYFTDKSFTPAAFSSICTRVRRELEEQTPVELAEANQWADTHERVKALPPHLDGFDEEWTYPFAGAAPVDPSGTLERVFPWLVLGAGVLALAIVSILALRR